MDMGFKYEELIKELCGQNPLWEGSSVRIVRSYELNKNGKTNYSALLETNYLSFLKDTCRS